MATDSMGSCMSTATANRKPDRSKANHRTNWSCKLDHGLHLKDGRSLATLADVRAFLLSLPEDYQDRQGFRRTTELLLEAAGTGKTKALVEQLKCALLHNVMLDVRKTR
jgi:hypothetical protein